MNVTVKTAAEQEKMRAAGRLAASVLDIFEHSFHFADDLLRYPELLDEIGQLARGFSHMVDSISTLMQRAADRARDESCPLDLNALVQVPDKLLRLGPEDPAVLAWLWENWGTTWMLRDVALAPVGRAGVVAAPGHDGVSYRFWSADWTPWRALATVRTRWPALARGMASFRGVTVRRRHASDRRRSGAFIITSPPTSAPAM